MVKRIRIIRTEDCPCKGSHGWKWHKARDLSPCEKSREMKHNDRRKWEAGLEQRKLQVQLVIAENPAEIPWVAGAPIYLDEEERST